jgi:hypothetical protein
MRRKAGWGSVPTEAIHCQLPVDAEVLGQERADDQPGAVVHPPLALQLPHPRVDQREAGAPLAPRLERPPGSAPPDRAAVALLELGPGVAGKVEQDVVMEVAPAQLAPERLRPLPAARSCLGLARRDAAEVQVRRQPRGPVAVQRIADARVLGRVAGQEPLQPPAPLRLSARRWLIHLLLEAERRERRDLALREPRRQRRQPPRGSDDLAPRLLLPGAVERREDRVRLAGACPRRADVVDHAEAGVAE